MSTKQTKSFAVHNGSLVIMYGTKLQEIWKHSIEKMKLSQLRINLSFRHHYTNEMSQIFKKIVQPLSRKFNISSLEIQKILSKSLY